uniref:uncharacterized protein LOC120341496 isoform X2 n=1 Tax=Styela clava TaxID=7725 RepID=UPI001939E50D|nr:uncharacterized protein LOC120341496 isoform X2 [Styela clava]
MPAGTHCAVPGCSYSYVKSRKAGQSVKTLFSVLRPDLAKTPQERKHREGLSNFLLAMRDSSRGDNIKAMLHKETASICEDHFLGTDILRHGKKSSLRLGAVPCRKIPRSSAVYQEKTRPLPAVREPLPEKIRYRSTRSLVSATSYLSQSMKDKWALYEHRGKFIAEMRKDDYCVPSIREDGAMQSAHFSGWKVEIAKLGVDRCDTLNSVLDKLGKLELCCGIDRRDGSTLVHPVLSWGGDKINIKNIYRSTSCSTIVDVSIGCPMCSSCMSEQFKNDEEEHHPSQVMLQVDDTVHDMIKLANSNAHPSSRRYHPDVIRWAMELYCRSPSAYDHLRTSQVLTLPSPSTLNRYRNVIPPQSGINKLALKEMERVIKDKGSLIGFVALDEMKVRENLVCCNGKLIGFVDKEMARNGNNNQLASHILVFYVRTVKRDLSIPLAWYATRNSPDSKLCRVFWNF